tara:strand:- start:13688 stop:14152 length:465 start_codon:yes stop_codon:yes gene_type:complete
MTTQSSVGTLAGDLDSILRSFASMLEGIYHIDEELAAEMAEKFSNKLRENARAIYAEMTAEISEGLKKPAKKPRKRRMKPEIMESSEFTDAPDHAIGLEELPEQDSTLLHADDAGDVDLLAERLLNNTRATDRAGGAGTSSWDTNNPTMRRIGK